MRALGGEAILLICDLLGAVQSNDIKGGHDSYMDVFFTCDLTLSIATAVISGGDQLIDRLLIAVEGHSCDCDHHYYLSLYV